MKKSLFALTLLLAGCATSDPFVGTWRDNSNGTAIDMVISKTNTQYRIVIADGLMGDTSAQLEGDQLVWKVLMTTFRCFAQSKEQLQCSSSAQMPFSNTTSESNFYPTRVKQ